MLDVFYLPLTCELGDDVLLLLCELDCGVLFERPPPLGLPVVEGHPPPLPCPVMLVAFGIPPLLEKIVFCHKVSVSSTGFRLVSLYKRGRDLI